MEATQNKIIDRIPTPQEIRRELHRNQRDKRLLRLMLMVAEQVEKERKQQGDGDVR